MTNRPDAHWNFEDDPRLTAYALGELPADERAEIDALLVGNAAAQRFVEETRDLAVVLQAGFGDSANLLSCAPASSEQPGALDAQLSKFALSPAQRATVRAAAGPTGSPSATSAARTSNRTRIFRVENWAIPARIAAVALVAVAFAERREIGAWWTADDRDVARAPGDVTSVGWGPSSNAQFGAAGPEVTLGLGHTSRTELTADFSSGITMGGGGGAPGNASGRPSSGAYFNNNSDGDYRARVENIFDRPLEPGRFREAGGGAGRAVPRVAGAARRVLRGTTRGYLFKAFLPGSNVPGPSGGAGGGGGGGGGLEEDFSQIDEPFVTNGLADGNRFPGQDVNLDPTGELTTDEKASETDLPRLRLLFSTRDEPVADATLTINFLKAEGLFDPRIATATYDVEIAQAAAIGDPVARRAKLVGIVERAQRRAEGNPAGYAAVEDNPFRTVGDSPLSTFGIDVDTASYANVRRFLDQGALPPPGAVRIEEMVNYFPYRYAPPADGDPFAVQAEVAGCPWNTAHRLVRIGLKGREVDLRERPQSNLVFLLDVSGSMQPANRLPLVVQSMRRLVEQLDARDKVSIVVYAGAAGMVLPPTAGDQHATILGALDRLQAGGSTAGAAGIELAYKTAEENFVRGGTNRVILATDGDFNVGVSDDSSLVQLIQEKAKSNVFLSVLGVGDDNLQDAKMEQLADKGNGNYAYLDSLKEGSKVLVEQAAGTLLTIAKDVKLQIEFNPVRVAGWRLIGYENRVLATEDFANDKKDAGDMGAGHTVTALYEIVPATDTAPAAAVEPLRYQRRATPTDTALTNELLAVKLRFKQPDGDVSTLREVPVTDSGVSFDAASADFHFAASVAAFGMLLRNSEHRGTATYDMVAELAMSGLSYDPGSERAGFVDLVRKAKSIATGAALPK